MTRLLPLAALLAAATGCIYVDGDRDRTPRDTVVVTPVNQAPIILDAWASCGWDTFNRDDVWTFDAAVDDPDGVFDVVQVYADVYDDASGALIESFPLYPTDDPFIWFSDWLGSTTYLDCFYPYYSVDFVAYDGLDAYDAVTVWPQTYR